MAPCKHQVYASPPTPPCIETMETVDTVLSVWQISSSSSPTTFIHITKAVYTCLQAHTSHHFPFHNYVTRTCKCTQVNTMWDILVKYLPWHGGLSLLCRSVSPSALLCLDSAWIRMSLYAQTASVLIHVQALSREQMKVTHYFQTPMKFPLNVDRLSCPWAPENVCCVMVGGGRMLTLHHVLQSYSWHSFSKCWRL